MVELEEEYEPERVKVFFKYLVQACLRHERAMRKEDLAQQIRDAGHARTKEFEDRIITLSEERKQEIEKKIDVFYSKNKYMPLEVKLKKLKQQFTEMKRSKRTKKKKLDEITEKIRRCELLLRRIERLDAEHSGTSKAAI
ncbi:MAG: hypothetical protein HGA85_06405 [Nanoarchaeota archaeon]|nr:hypothetical protein [Nanoarchaeota archaeon]